MDAVLYVVLSKSALTQADVVGLFDVSNSVFKAHSFHVVECLQAAKHADFLFG